MLYYIASKLVYKCIMKDLNKPNRLILPTPDLSAAAFIAPNATVVGRVTIAEGASIWYNAVVRADVEEIQIGAYTNIQDGAILHGDPGQPTILADYVTVGHQAVIHGALIETGCLIGIGSVILNGVKVGAGSMIGAGAIVTKNVAPRSVIVGMPGKKVREMDSHEVEELYEHARKYAKLALVHAGKGQDLGFNPS